MRAVLGQRLTVVDPPALVERLVQAFGEPADVPARGLSRLFPKAGILLRPIWRIWLSRAGRRRRSPPWRALCLLARSHLTGIEGCRALSRRCSRSPTWMKTSCPISPCEALENRMPFPMWTLDSVGRWARVEELLRRRKCCAVSKSLGRGALTPPCTCGQRRSKLKDAFAPPRSSCARTRRIDSRLPLAAVFLSRRRRSPSPNSSLETSLARGSRE